MANTKSIGWRDNQRDVLGKEIASYNVVIKLLKDKVTELQKEYNKLKK